MGMIHVPELLLNSFDICKDCHQKREEESCARKELGLLLEKEHKRFTRKTNNANDEDEIHISQEHLLHSFAKRDIRSESTVIQAKPRNARCQSLPPRSRTRRASADDNIIEKLRDENLSLEAIREIQTI